MKKFLLLMLLYAAPNYLAIAQNDTDSKKNLYLEQAKEQMQEEDYQAANLTFRKILSLKTDLPPEMCYLFAKTLYQIGQFQNSANFVDKYLELTGSSGKFYKSSQTLKNLLEKEFSKTKTCSRCNYQGYVLKSCPTCHAKGSVIQTCETCRGAGTTPCPACKGSGVIITQDIMLEKKYTTCYHCHGEKTVHCSSCHGEKTTENICLTCLGAKQVASSTLCTHQDDNVVNK